MYAAPTRRAPPEGGTSRNSTRAGSGRNHIGSVQLMEHTSASDIDWALAPAENFTGTVRFGPLSDRSPEALNALAVHFDPGARTDWHTHPVGQVLYITNGAGLVQTDDGDTVEVAAGDVVYSPPGEVHWHGARPNSPMTHLSLTTGGATEWLPRKVTDAEFGRR